MKRLYVVAAVASLGLQACAEAPTASPMKAPVSGPLLAVTVDQSRVTVSDIATNPCGPVPEDIAFSGYVHFVTQTFDDGFSSHSNWFNVKGTGVTSGQQYVLTMLNQFSAVWTGTGTANEHMQQFRLISSGSGGNYNLKVREAYTFPPLVITLSDWRIECTGL